MDEQHQFNPGDRVAIVYEDGGEREGEVVRVLGDEYREPHVCVLPDDAETPDDLEDWPVEYVVPSATVELREGDTPAAPEPGARRVPAPAEDQDNLGPTWWHREITAGWRASVTGILGTAQLCRSAFNALDEDGRHALQELLPFGPETWRRLRELGDCQPLQDADPTVLPASWRTLWELSRIDAETLDEHLDAGHIHPELTVREAIELREGPSEPGPRSLRGFDGGERQGETVERLTPFALVDRCRRALGGRIDLDPCASPARLLPGIGTHYTREGRIVAGQGLRVWGETAQPDAHGRGGGLAVPWAGTAFVNPPYGPELPAWAAKFRREYQAGELAGETAGMVAGCLLVPGRLGTRWWRALEGCPRAELHQRLRFVDGRGEDLRNVAEGPEPAMFPSVVFYAGPDPWTFAEAFAEVATIHGVPERPVVDLTIAHVDVRYLEDLVDPLGTASLEDVREHAAVRLAELEARPTWCVPWASELPEDAELAEEPEA